MTSEDRYTRTATAAAAHLAWCNTIPHTLDQIIGIYVERLSQQGRPLARARLTNDELLGRITGGQGGGKGGHSDPTGDAATRGAVDLGDDADETIGQMTAAVADIAATADLLDHGCSDALGQDRWHLTQPTKRQDRIRHAEARILHAIPLLTTLAGNLTDAMRFQVDAIAESALWLRTKAEGIWLDHRGETLPEARQRTLTVCRIHAQFVKDPPLARHGVGGLCDQCDNFKRNHQAEPTEAIIKRWDWSKAATPAQILEAKARRKGA